MNMGPSWLFENEILAWGTSFNKAPRGSLRSGFVMCKRMLGPRVWLALCCPVWHADVVGEKLVVAPAPALALLGP